MWLSVRIFLGVFAALVVFALLSVAVTTIVARGMDGADDNARPGPAVVTEQVPAR